MSHYWNLKCRTCGESTDGVNRGDGELIAAAQTAQVVRLLAESGAWDISSLTTSRVYHGVASFVAEHAAHDDFWVESEYGEKSYPSVRVPVTRIPDLGPAAAVAEAQTASGIARWVDGWGILCRGLADGIRRGDWKDSGMVVDGRKAADR